MQKPKVFFYNILNFQEFFSLGSVEQSANDLFFDTEEDFCQVQNIISRILKWLAIDEDSFEKAYVSLCLPKLLGPFIRLQMLNWRPLKVLKDFDFSNWTIYVPLNSIFY